LLKVVIQNEKAAQKKAKSYDFTKLYIQNEIYRKVRESAMNTLTIG